MMNGDEISAGQRSLKDGKDAAGSQVVIVSVARQLIV